jgi:hypothetical protein
VLDSLQLTSQHSVATPADWKNGEDVIVALQVPTDQIEEKYWQTPNIKKPYLRYIKQP